MKKSIIFIAAALVLSACTKEYKCELTGTTTVGGNEYPINQVSSFSGTKKEVKAHEAKNTVSNNMTNTEMRCK